MKNRTLKHFSDKNKGKLKKSIAIGLGAGAGLGTALGGNYLINKEASDKLVGVDDNIKNIEGLTDSQRINMQKKLDELSDTYGDSNASYDRALGNTELERKLLENQARIDHQITPEQQMKAIRDVYDNPNDYKTPATIKDKLADFLGTYGENDKLGLGNYDVEYFRNDLDKPINNFSSSITPIYFAQKMSKAEKLKANQKIINQKVINHKDPVVDTPTIPANSTSSTKKESSKSPRNDFEAREKDIKTSQGIDKTRFDKQSSDWAEKIARGAASTFNVIKNSGNLAKLAGTGIKNSVANKLNSVRHAIGGKKDKLVNGVKNFFTGGKSAVEQKYGRGEIDKDLVKANKSLATKQAKANSTPEQRPGFKDLMSEGWKAAKAGGSGTIQKLRDHSNQSMKEVANARQQKRNISDDQQYNLRQARRNAKTGNTGGYRQFFFSDGTPNRFALTNFAMNNPVFELESQLMNTWNHDINLQQMFSDYYEFEEYFITNFSDLDYSSDYLSQFEPIIDYAASMTIMTNNTYFNFSTQVLNDMGDCLIVFANKDTQLTANKNKGVGTDNYGYGLYGKHDSGIHFAPETQQRIQEEGQRYFSRWSSAYVNAIGNSLGLNEQSPIQFQANSNERMQEFLDPSSNFSAKDVAISALLPAGVAFGGTSLINAIDGYDRFDPAVSAALSGGLGLTTGIVREISNRDAEKLTLQRLKEALDEKKSR